MQCKKLCDYGLGSHWNENLWLYFSLSLAGRFQKWKVLLAPEASHQPVSLNQVAKQTGSALLDTNFMPQLENSSFLE